jgi:hypothetical protein
MQSLMRISHAICCAETIHCPTYSKSKFSQITIIPCTLHRHEECQKAYAYIASISLLFPKQQELTDCQCNFTHLDSLFQVVLRRASVRKWKFPIQNRFEFTGNHQIHHFIEILARTHAGA